MNSIQNKYIHVRDISKIRLTDDNHAVIEFDEIRPGMFRTHQINEEFNPAMAVDEPLPFSDPITPDEAEEIAAVEDKPKRTRRSKKE